MLKSTVQKILRHLAMPCGKFSRLYTKFCNPSSEEYTKFLRRHSNLYALSSNCSILPSTVFTDPAYVRIGNNVHFSSCTLIGREGGFDPAIEPQLVQLRVSHFYSKRPTSTVTRAATWRQPTFNK